MDFMLEQLRWIRSASLATLLGIGLFAWPAAAPAVPAAYTSEGDWLAALPAGLTTFVEDLESAPLGLLSGTTDVGAFDVIVSPDAVPGTEIVAGGQVNGTRELTALLDCDSCASTTTQLDFVFAEPVFGIAADWDGPVTGEFLTATINGVTINFQDHFGFSGEGFLGFVDDAGFSSVVFGTELTFPSAPGDGEVFSVDDIRIATTPEPALPLLLVAALLAAGGRARRSGAGSG